MFNFKKRALNPFLRDALEAVDQALTVEDTAQRLEKLLGVKDKLSEDMRRIRNRETNKGTTALMGMITGYGIAGLATAMSGGVLSLLAPPILAGAAVAGVSLFAFFKTIANRDRITADENTVKSLIDREVMRSFEAKPQEAVQSPRLAKQLKAAFGAVSKPGRIEKLRQRLLMTPAPASAP